MDLNQRTLAFVALGKVLQQPISNQQIQQAIEHSCAQNPWFTPAFIAHRFLEISHMLSEEKLVKWASSYTIQTPTPPLSIAIIMAGNIPLVGFHDLLCVLLSGHKAICKISSKDKVLMHFIVSILLDKEPLFSSFIVLTEEKLPAFDAVIATGSDNTSRYFDYYFGKYPHIIRHNRNSIAVLTGKETSEELSLLGKDIFTYFGLGCRNVSHLWVPTGYDFSLFFASIESYSFVGNHNKYINNYEYTKSIFLINGVPHFDNGFLLITQEDKIASPIASLYISYYSKKEEIKQFIDTHKTDIQCVVAANFPNSLPFGTTQLTQLGDYADNVDTMDFLQHL